MKDFIKLTLFFIVISLGVLTSNGGSIGLSTRIVGGGQAEEGAFPYQVSLRTNHIHSCGGTIVTVLHIVSAAHCFPSVNIDQMTVITGTDSLASGGETHSVVAVTLHPSYSIIELWAYDFAIVTLASELTVTPLQSPIPLATTSPPVGAEVIISGWGRIFFESIAWPTKLQYMTGEIMSNEECGVNVNSTGLRDVHLCAFKHYGTSVCSGDSGGPMVYNGELVGVVSWGSVPCGGGTPDVFARVNLMLDFVQSVIGTSLSK